MKITHLSATQVEVDFSTIPLIYETATLVLPSKRIIIDLETGQIQDYLVDNQVKIPTLHLVREFETYLKRRDRADSTIAGYHAVLATLAEFLPDWPPAVDELNTFFDRYRDKDYSPVTLAEYWSRVNTWFNWAKEHHYILVNPMNHVPQPHLPEIEARVIPPQDFVKAINVLREVSADARPRQRCLPYERAIRDLAILRFTYATGCRVGEVAGLRLRDLHLETSQAKVQAVTSKSKKWRTVYFGRQAKTSLENWLEIRPRLSSDQLFLGTRGNGWSKKHFTGAGIYQAWQTWQQMANIGPYEFHEIRHSHVTHSLENGVPIHHVSRQAGHSSPDITLRVYAHSQDPERQHAYLGKNPDDTLELRCE